MTVVTAHRGASAAHPPGNTLVAFSGARTLGADWVELDVRLTADGTLVVHHDDHLADGAVIAELTADDLPEWVPTLAAALDACAPMGVNVEIKVDHPVSATPVGERLVADTVALLLDAPPVGGLVVSCFDWSVADRIAREAPSLPTALLAFDLADGPRHRRGGPGRRSPRREPVGSVRDARARGAGPWRRRRGPQLDRRRSRTAWPRWSRWASTASSPTCPTWPEVCSTPRRDGERRAGASGVARSARPAERRGGRRDDQAEHRGLVAQAQVLHLAQVVAVDLVGEGPVAR